jgi:membrane-associated protein
LIAFTFGNEENVKPGGTANTVAKFLKKNKSENSWHVDLNTFKIYQGAKVFSAENARFFKREYLEKAERFYEKHGKKTIIIARFIPIIRTFAPFVAGIGNMSYPQFIAYNIIGGITWVGLFLGAGYVFGNVPIVKHNFTLVIMSIIAVSFLPGIIEYIRHKRA